MVVSARRWTAKEARATFATAPTACLNDLAPSGMLVVVAPHPDDETLGCGGLIATACAEGRRVVVALLTDGAASHPKSSRFDADGRRRLRESELDAALRTLSGDSAEVASFQASDGALERSVDEAAAWLTDLVAEGGPCTFLVTWDADPHPDHKAAFTATCLAAEATNSAVWAYPIWGLTLADDDDAGLVRHAVSFDISAQVSRKGAAIACHASQLDALVMNDPAGFLLTPGDVKRHAGPREVFLAIRKPD